MNNVLYIRMLRVFLVSVKVLISCVPGLLISLLRGLVERSVKWPAFGSLVNLTPKP